MSDYIVAQTTVDTTNHQLVFNNEGYYAVGDDEWQDIVFTSTLTYKGGNIGIAPRIYDTNMYMYLNIHNEDADELGVNKIGLASLNAQVTFSTLSLAQVTIPPLVSGQDYKITAEIKGTNFRISLDDKMIFNIEYPGMSRGKVAVYSTAGNVCKSIQVDSLFADGWSSNANTIPGGIVSIREFANEDKYLYLKGISTSTLNASQARTVQSGKAHSFSFDYKGTGSARLRENNGAAPKTFTYALPAAEDWTRVDFTEMISVDCTNVTIFFYVTKSELMVNSVQLEPKSFSTGYIHNDSATAEKIRESSIITYPSKDNIRSDIGSLVMWFSPGMTYPEDSAFKPVLFETGDKSVLRLSHESGEMVFKYANGEVRKAAELIKDEWMHVVATWTSSKIQLYVNGELVEKEGVYGASDESPLIRIGHSTDTARDTFYGSIDETIVLSSVLSKETVEEMGSSIEPFATNNSMTMRATFNYAIGNFNKSIIEATLAPDYGSPVLVEKADGTEMRKVSFFDYYTGEYRTFNEELVEYDASLSYVTLSYHDKDVDQESFKIQVETDEGVTYGTPYQLVGRKLFLSLSDDEKKFLDGKYLYVTYQLEDSYTVDFNIGVVDSFRITLGKHDGKPVRVVYEGNGFTDEKLLTMVEMNPLLNPNHEGFLYVTRNDEPVTGFRIQATPSDLPANGGSESLIVVEPLDTNGNYISHCELMVSCEKGTIVPAYDEQSIKLRDRAGRFLYRYRSPILTIKQAGGFETQDAINVIDKETGIGVQLPITLTALYEKNHKLVATDTIETVSEHYGSTMADIAYSDDMMAKVKAKYGTAVVRNAKTPDQVVANARRYILEMRSSGATIKVPVNYSSKQLQKNAVAIQHEKMIAYLIDKLMKYMNMPAKNLPSGLGALLDFNRDGVIGINEVKWLKDNRLTTVLQEKYESVVKWYSANQG